MNEITDTKRLERILSERPEIILLVNKYGKGAIGNPIVGILNREDIDAVIEAEEDAKNNEG